MDRMQPDLALAAEEYRRQGLHRLYGQSFDALLLPHLSRAEAVVGGGLAWSGEAETDLLAALLSCRSLLDAYRQRGIPREIFDATAADIGRWAKIHWACTGSAGLSEHGWIANHLGLRLFQLGRLQFLMEQADVPVPAFGIRAGEDLVSIHICRGGGLTAAACDASLAQARAFFPRYFPDCAFRYFICRSWLLDDTILPFLPPASNIAAFQRRFQIVSKTPSDAILRYLFRWDLGREDLAAAAAQTSFQQQVKQRALSGGLFYEATGLIPR